MFKNLSNAFINDLKELYKNYGDSNVRESIWRIEAIIEYYHELNANHDILRALRIEKLDLQIESEFFNYFKIKQLSTFIALKEETIKTINNEINTLNKEAYSLLKNRAKICFDDNGNQYLN